MKRARGNPRFFCIFMPDNHINMYMRIHVLFCLILCSFFVSCGKTPTAPEKVIPSLTVFTSNIDFEKEGGSATIVFTTNVNWTATCDASWVTLNSRSGGGSAEVQEVTVTVGKNDDNTRETKVVIAVEDRSAYIPIIQKSPKDDGLTALTVAQFKAKPENQKNWYKLTGEIVSVVNSQYGDFYLMDDTGYIYVYGLAPAKGGSTSDYSKIGLKPGNIVSIAALRKRYNGIDETDQAYYLSHEEGKYPGYSYSYARESWLELPATVPTNDIVYLQHMMPDGRRNYSIWFDKKNRIASWICYPLYTGESSTGRSDAYAYDPLVDEEFQANLSKSYQNRQFGDEEYVRGHLLPSYDRAGRANLDVFLSTNIIPQSSALNSGVWGDMESRIRSLENYCDTVYVAIGTDISNSTLKVNDISSPAKQITVPSGIYKVVLAHTKTGEYYALASYFENKANAADKFTKELSMSVYALEQKLGMDFFVNLPGIVGESKANAIEAENPADNKFWWQ